MPIDSFSVAAILAIAMLALCTGTLFLLWDYNSSPPQRVRRALWCSEKGHDATVDFIERVQTGMTYRTVQACSLRGADGTCKEECRYLRRDEMRPVLCTPS